MLSLNDLEHFLLFKTMRKSLSILTIPTVAMTGR